MNNYYLAVSSTTSFEVSDYYKKDNSFLNEICRLFSILSHCKNRYKEQLGYFIENKIILNTKYNDLDTSVKISNFFIKHIDTDGTTINLSINCGDLVLVEIKIDASYTVNSKETKYPQNSKDNVAYICDNMHIINYDITNCIYYTNDHTIDTQIDISKNKDAIDTFLYNIILEIINTHYSKRFDIEHIFGFNLH